MFGWRHNRQRKRVTASTPIISRRALLKLGLAAGATAIVWMGVKKVADKMAEIDARKQAKYDEVNRLPHVSTRKPSSVREIIEKTPDIATHEAGWYKQKGKPGQLRWAALSRSHDQVEFVPPLSTDSSEIHTHPLLAFPKDMPRHLRNRAASQHSRPDLVRFIDAYRRLVEGEGNHALRKTHIAVVDEKGKVRGCFSILLGKKSRDRIILTWMQMVNASYQYELMTGYTTKNWKMVEDALARYDKFFEAAKKKGLRVRASPADGFVYKDGQFQPKD